MRTNQEDRRPRGAFALDSVCSGWKIGAILVCVMAIPVWGGEINLEWRSTSQAVQVGETVSIGLYAVSADGEECAFSSLQAIFEWDATKLRLVGVDETGSPSLWVYGFLADPYGLNETVPPQDGDGLFGATAYPGESISVSGEGTLVMSFVFEALESTFATDVRILEQAGSPIGETFVLDEDGYDAVGTLGGVSVEITPVVPGDFDGDDVVGLSDIPLFVEVLLGLHPESAVVADMNADGKADGIDAQPFIQAILGS